MGSFTLTVYHGGRFGYKEGTLQYIGGEKTVIEDVDSDCWSIFEAYAELGQFGYTKENIAALWYKDPASEWLEKALKLFATDRDTLKMCKIASLRGYVEVFVVHVVEDAEEFPEAGFIDVGGQAEQNPGNELVVYEGEKVQEMKNDNVQGVNEKDQVDTDVVTENDRVESNSDDDSDDDEEYDDESGFEEDTTGKSSKRVDKGKGIMNGNFSDEEGFNSDEVDLEYEVGVGSGDEEGEGEDKNEGRGYPINKECKDMNTYKWEEGTVFASREEFKDTVTSYAVQSRRGLRYAKLDLVRVRAVCQPGCPFWLYAAKTKNESTWQLRSINLKHTCGQSHRVGILHTSWLSRAFKKKVEHNPRVKIKELVNKAQRKWNLTVTTSMAARSRQAALDDIQGEYRKQYKRIGDYCYELLRSNPGSSVTLKVQRSPDFEHEQQSSSLNNYCIFKRLYVCLDACKKSILQCRKFIGLDGCFLKTPQGGQMLTAIGWDPNDQMLPIAYAVVEATFMSDQQKGLLPAFDEVIPGVDHRFCVRHLYSNFTKKFPGLQLKQLMWRCAKATHWKDWEREMAVIRSLNVEAHRHLNSIPPRFWSRSRFSFHSKCDTLVNNMCESFNGAIVDSREKPIITMLEEIRVYLMNRWAVNRERIQKFNGRILPRIRKKIERRGRAAGEWRPYWSAAQTYEVVNGLSKYAVDLSLRECSCRKWQLSGIPCTHVISCINFKGLELDQYVDDCYKRDAYVKCYESAIHPLNGPDLWEHTNFDDVMPPSYRRPSHRPVKKRKRGPEESENRCHTHLSRRGRTQRCSRCGVVGHKRGRCSNPPLTISSVLTMFCLGFIALFSICMLVFKCFLLGILQAQPPKETGAKKATRGRKSTTSKPVMQTATRGRKRSRGQGNPSSQPQPAMSSTPITRSKSSHSQPIPKPSTTATRPNTTAAATPQSRPNKKPIKKPIKSSTQPPPVTKDKGASSSSQPMMHKVSFSHNIALLVSPRKLRLMAKLPPREWEKL
ncbi:hypothetical protein Ahy_A07g035175 [Arachis hypogaea]|uniref:SWIM-type domain-containing protein n=1 Tax=Arachis hypogaea TaxID=3818 RepID=A0A445CDN4_ARAHY|nr:hypothetical protein Ahy_A07g035175 [Arachis hypogaea]